MERTLDLNSFLFPLVQDLKKLAVEGVACRKWEERTLINFTLRGHLILVNGDMPAVVKVGIRLSRRDEGTHFLDVYQLMHFKGHTGKTPCRWCTVQSVPYVSKIKAKQSLQDPGVPAATVSATRKCSRASMRGMINEYAMQNLTPCPAGTVVLDREEDSGLDSEESDTAVEEVPSQNRRRRLPAKRNAERQLTIQLESLLTFRTNHSFQSSSTSITRIYRCGQTPASNTTSTQ